MKKIIEPQTIFIYNYKGHITKTIFLTYDPENLLDSKQFQLYKYYKSNTDIFENDNYEIQKNHILLTLNIAEIKGYIRYQILKTDLSILLFSIWNNIDYSNKDNSIFNPFDLKNQIYERNSDNTLIYKIYKQAAFNIIFCVLDENNTLSNLCSLGVYKEQIYSFVDSILSIDLKKFDPNNELHISSKSLNNIIYNIQWYSNLLYDIKNIDDIKKISNEKYLNYIYISGDKLILNDNNTESQHVFIIYNDNDYKNYIFKITDNILDINNIQEYENFLLIYPKLENLIIKQKLVKQTIQVDYNISISSLVLDYNIDFFIDLTEKTKNIFLDRSRSINIITSSKHIFYSTYHNTQVYLYEYITKFIIGLQILKNRASFVVSDKKKGSRYYSRYCQGNRIPEKITLSEINLKDYIEHNNIYYENKNNAGDIYFNKDIQQYVICKSQGIYNIGFVKELYQGYNICLPCCYKNRKNNTEIFNNCVNNIDKKIKIQYDPYVHIFKQYRVIVNPNKISLLLDKLNKLFNSYDDQKIQINKYGKIEYANNYNIYISNTSNIDLENIESIINNDELGMYFKDNVLYYNPNILNNYYNDYNGFINNINFYLIIQNKIHIIKAINKNLKDNIEINDISIDIKKHIIEKYLNVNPYYNKYFINNIKTKYIYKLNVITLKKNTIGYYITNVLYKKYFDIIYPLDNEDKNLYKITFLTNLINILKIDINFNLIFDEKIHKELIINVSTVLNKNFIK